MHDFIIHEYLRTYEVQRREQLFQAVLQRDSGDETGDERPNDLREDGVDVLDAMCFIDDYLFEAEFFERGLLGETYFITRCAHVEVLTDESVRNRALSFGRSNWGRRLGAG